MRELLAQIDTWSAEGLSVARAVVIRTFGSSPRREGAAMLRTDDGRISGSVSGGCIEGATAERMKDASTSGLQRVVRFGVSDEDAWDVGLACGGTIDVLVQPSVPQAVLRASRETAQDRSAGQAVVTVLPPGSPDGFVGTSQAGPSAAVAEPPVVVFEDGHMDGSLGDPAADAELVEQAAAAIASGTSRVAEVGELQVFVEAFPVRPRLVVVGAVEVAASLVKLASDLGYETVVIDARPAFATRERFPSVDQLIEGWPDEVAEAIDLGRGDAVAVLSHDPKFDEPAITVALQRGCRYVGAIGSRKTQRARRERLSARGLSETQLARLHGPIGLDLGGRDPAETALAIMSEIVAARYAGSGRPMIEVVADRERG
jgi:xanthine dehydrogenase accessory factor